MRASWWAAATAAVALLSWSTLALAEEEEEEEEGNFDEQDVAEEVLTPEQLRALHAKFDQDSDGKVSLQELASFASVIGREIAALDSAPILQEIDTSKDGKLSLEEHLADIHHEAEVGDEEEMRELAERKELETAKHRAADSNGDGVLDAGELPGLFYPETHDGVLGVSVAATLRQKDADGNGKLSPKEFWGAQEPEAGESDPLSDEERSDFAKLDADQDGFLDEVEIGAWESGRFHTVEAMKRLIEIADKDSDMHITADELAAAVEEIAISDAQYHLIEWAAHAEL